MSGAQLYGQLCTSCHGASGRGNGPLAPVLKVDVPDLTHIAKRHGGEFSAEQVRRSIDGRVERPAHGLPYMPVWGLKLYDPAAPNAAGSVIERLVEYLRSIQDD